MEQYYFNLVMSDYVFSVASLVVGIIFLITRGPKAARLGIIVAGVMFFFSCGIWVFLAVQNYFIW